MIGIDPGSRENVVVYLDVTSARPRLYGWSKWSREMLCSVLCGLRGHEQVAIEIVEGEAFKSARVSALFQTQRAAGDAEGILIANGVRHECLSGREWRGEWLGFPTASNDAIRAAVESVVDFAPDINRIYATDRPHVYDAIGVALAALPRFGLQPVRLSPAALAAVHAAMGKARAKSAAKRKATLAKRRVR